MNIIKKFLKTGVGVKNFFLDLVYPDYCYYCKDFITDKNVFCSKCSKNIISVVTTFVEVTKTHKIKVFAVSDYKYPVRALVLAKGSSDIIASRKMGQLIWDMTYLKNAEFDFIIPIPLYWKRYAERGYNQAFEMAKIIGKNSNKPVLNILNRTKSTIRQSELSPEKRALNVHDAFEINIKALENMGLGLEDLKEKRILLVDDLLTTGSTIKASAKVILKLKPKDIIAAVACRVV